MKTVKKLEFKINIKETPKDKIEGLILGLVYSGYPVYFDYKKENVCFNGWSDEIITQKVEAVEGTNEI